MDEMKVRLADAVAAKLTAAPQSDAKDELMEELSDNLYRRFLDMTGAGVPEEDAFQRALDDLGDVDELLSYLGVAPGADVVINQEDGQTRIETRDGQRIIINGADDGHIVINTGDALREDAEAAPEEAQAGSPFEGDVRYGYQPQDGSQGRKDEQGDTHYDRQIPQSDLESILAGVSEACNTAIDQAKVALRQAKEALQRRTTVQRDNGHVRVHFNTQPDAPGTPEAPEPPETPETPEPPEASEAPNTPEPPKTPEGWEFEAELDTDAGRFFAGAGPKQRKDVIYGFGYDKAKGGFFTQWGEWTGEHQGEGADFQGPRFTGEDSGMRPNDDGSYSVTALKDLRGIEVFTTSGDVTIHVSETPDAGVIIDGDVDELDVTCSADGVLTIREGRTASSSFFSRRGFCSADVELFIPRRRWETIAVSTASGDIDIDREALDIDSLTVTTASGDLNCRLRACRVLRFKSASGDIDLEGSCASLTAETMSGDISLRGQFENAALKSASGDIELEGLVCRFRGSAVSGDVSVETSAPPQAMDMSSKSGDCKARIPDAGPFSVRTKTVSGGMRCDFPVHYVDGAVVYGDGSGPVYSMSTVSGDLSLGRY